MTEKNHKKEKLIGIFQDQLLCFCENCPLFKKFQRTVCELSHQGAVAFWTWKMTYPYLGQYFSPLFS